MHPAQDYMKPFRILYDPRVMNLIAAQSFYEEFVANDGLKQSAVQSLWLESYEEPVIFCK